jgi:transcription-repair coupling factor (superfamily II helicase)
MNLDKPFFDKLSQALLSSNPPVLEELPSGAKAFITSSFFKAEKESILYLSAQASCSILDDAPFFGSSVLELPQSSELEASSDVKGMELKTLSVLKSNKHHIVVASIQSLIKSFIDPSSLMAQAESYVCDKEYAFTHLDQVFSKLGYIAKSIVTEKGTFAKRGGIIDIFPYDNTYPIRMEFDEDILVSLREFDPLLQTSIKKIPSFSLMGCSKGQLTHSIFDYLSKNPLIIFDGLEEIEEQWVFLQRIQKSLIDLPKHRCLFFAEKPLSVLFSDPEDTKKFLDLNLALKALPHPFLPPQSFFITSSKVSFEELNMEWPPFLSLGGQGFITYSTEAEKNVLFQNNVEVPLKPGFLSSGFYCPSPPLLALSFQDFSSKKHIRRSQVRMTSMSGCSDFDLISTGDIVVHSGHGIGKCVGIEKRVNHLGQEAEYFKLEFAEKALLYVPIKEAHQLTRYVGSGQSTPTFSQLGSNRWQKIKAQTQASIIGYSKQLLELAASRQLPKGFSYPKDSDIQIQFESDFPFPATDDQLKAIAAIKEDMQKGTPMDRLICGDVGYGKTEVAMRASFKAVVDGKKQVAVLVPTTVLAMQHFENFKERMANFAIKLGILSRFSTPKELKNTLKELKEGHIDIVIGTHRLLSSDVIFKDLGLMIIDEEQRFGVKSKEALKQLKTSIDCLTLSATPIPRTLYTSIVGMKQMSIIATPPYDRLPVRTILSVTDDQFIKQALLKEIARKGQSYFIHNRVENLPLIHKKISAMIPEAKIGIAHGQMDPEDIETIFHAFKTGKLDILIATTLIENGVDIPNANTILIDNAQNFGLSDLYQLRGRVGRWNKAATCYLLVPKNLNLDEPTRKRLEAIVSTSGYGGGLKIAMRDLEIRGSGDLLGIEQSGHVSQVGFTLYCKLLKKTLSALQKKQSVNMIETKIEFSSESKIPESYINDLDTRIEFYHRFGDIEDVKEAEQIFKELIDRFGPAPLSVNWLYVLARLKAFCQSRYIMSLSINKMTSVIEKSAKGKLEKISIAVNSSKHPLEFYKELTEKIDQIFN